MDNDEFFKSMDKKGGPIDPVVGFKEVYMEIFIKRAKKNKEENEEDMGEGDEERLEADQKK